MDFTCSICGRDAHKTKDGRRWVIHHHARCAQGVAKGTLEDIGPVTALNDPDNMQWEKTN